MDQLKYQVDQTGALGRIYEYIFQLLFEIELEVRAILKSFTSNTTTVNLSAFAYAKKSLKHCHWILLCYIIYISIFLLECDNPYK